MEIITSLSLRATSVAWQSSYNKVARSRVRALFTGLLRVARNDTVCNTCDNNTIMHQTLSLRATLVAWQSRVVICRASRGQYLLDCFATLAMTRVCCAAHDKGRTCAVHDKRGAEKNAPMGRLLFLDTGTVLHGIARFTCGQCTTRP